MTEQQPYEVVSRETGFEIRRYPAHIVAETTIAGSFTDAGNRAFRSLFNYIGGANQSRQPVAMTAPVLQSRTQRIAMTAPVAQRAEAGRFVVAFVLPANMTMATAPTPTQPEVTLREVPARMAAATRYSGRWTQKAFDSHRAALLSGIAAAGMTAGGEVQFARFDPPFKPSFLRHNEVVIDLVNSDVA